MTASCFTSSLPRLAGISETGTILTVSERPYPVGGLGCRAKTVWFPHDWKERDQIHTISDLQAVFLASFRKASSPSPSVLGSLAWRFQALHLVLVSLQPFLASRHYVLLCVLASREESFALDEIAGLTSGHKVIQLPGAAPGMGVNMVNRHDQPIFETLLSIQPTVLALEMVPLEDLHCQLTRNVGPGPKDKSLDLQ
jgi:hypothetical protein